MKARCQSMACAVNAFLFRLSNKPGHDHYLTVRSCSDLKGRHRPPSCLFLISQRLTPLTGRGKPGEPSDINTPIICDAAHEGAAPRLAGPGLSFCEGLLQGQQAHCLLGKRWRVCHTLASQRGGLAPLIRLCSASHRPVMK